MSLGSEFLRLKWGEKVSTIKYGMWASWKRITRSWPEDKRREKLSQIRSQYLIDLEEDEYA